MRFYLIRHGVAEDGRPDLPDDERALTKEGKRRTRQCMRGLARIASFDAVATSPLVRARETAEIVCRVFDLPPAEAIPELAPGGDLARLLARFEQAPDDTRVALVGHMPHLGCLAGLLGFGDAELEIELDKAGVARLTGASRPGEAVLEWLVTPRVLRALR